MPLSYSNQDHTFIGDYIIPVLNSKHDFCYIYSNAYPAQTFNIALTVATHISLRHLAAIIPSQLNNYFLPSFLPSFLRDLQHKGALYSGCH